MVTKKCSNGGCKNEVENPKYSVCEKCRVGVMELNAGLSQLFKPVFKKLVTKRSKA
jgi:hypothetical protein